MPRPCIKRNVSGEPISYYFKPAGIRKVELEESELALDEFEAIRLIDLEGVEQTKAAEQMNVSQPTFSRILKQGRKKIAEAIIIGKAIKIENRTKYDENNNKLNQKNN
jgi:uncharacterized protein